MMIGLVGSDSITARERLDPWLCRCGYCGARRHVGDAEPAVVHYCDAICKSRDLEERRSATVFDIGLAFAIKGLVALAATLGVVTIARATFFGN